MNMRELNEALGRWRERGFLSGEQAASIASYELTERGIDVEEHSPVEAGMVLSYAGVAVALGAILGLYATVLDDLDAGPRLGLMWLVALAALGAGVLVARMGAGAAADGLGFATAVLLGFAVFQVFDVIGWVGERAFFGEPGFERDLHELRVTWTAVGLAVGFGGWAIARTLPAPLAALASAGGAGIVALMVGWWFGGTGQEDPGISGAQTAVVIGFALAAVALWSNLLRLDDLARTWWIIGGLATANIAGFAVAIAEGGVYEGLLLFYALGLAASAIVGRRRAPLVFAFITLYQYVGLVVFRTFDGAVAAIIVMALVGLGTALGGAAVQRGIVERLLMRRG